MRWVDEGAEAPWFYIFALVNAAIYRPLFLVSVVNHIRETPAESRRPPRDAMAQLACVAVLGLGIAMGFVERGREAAIALASTSSEVSLNRSGYVVAGAGQGRTGDVQGSHHTDWPTTPVESLKARGQR